MIDPTKKIGKEETEARKGLHSDKQMMMNLKLVKMLTIRIVMNRYGMNGPEDELEKVLWEYLKNMFEAPLSIDPIWSSLDKSSRGYPDEDCYITFENKWEKQVGIRNPPRLTDKKDRLVKEHKSHGKDFSNPLMADNLPKIVWLSTHHVSPKLVSEPRGSRYLGLFKVFVGVDFMKKRCVKVSVLEDGLEEFLMDDSFNGDLGNFLQDNNLFPNYENPGTNSPSPNKSSREIWSPTKGFQDFDNDLNSRIDEFVAIDDLWGDLDSGALNSEQPLKPEFHNIGNKVNRYNPYNLQITYKIGFVNFKPYIDSISSFNVMSRAAYNSIMKREITYIGNNIVGKAKNLQVFIGCHSFLTNFIILENMNEFVKKGLIEVVLSKPFNEKIRLEEDISKGRIWFKIGDDKTIFSMPRAERRLSKLTTEQQNMISPILKISDKDKAKGISFLYEEIGIRGLLDSYSCGKVLSWHNHLGIGYHYLSQHDWHCRLGHPAEPVLNVLKDSLQIDNMDKNRGSHSSVSGGNMNTVDFTDNSGNDTNRSKDIFATQNEKKSKKQNTLSKSSTEAEYRTLASVTSEVIWILKILKDLNIENLLPVSLHYDSNSAIKIAANPVFHERTKHLEIDLHFVREIFLKVVKCVKVDYANQIADILTKGLDALQHN
ncbi:hypothetical protein Tco_0776812 [Tanacetum coccineum]